MWYKNIEENLLTLKGGKNMKSQKDYALEVKGILLTDYEVALKEIFQIAKSENNKKILKVLKEVGF